MADYCLRDNSHLRFDVAFEVGGERARRLGQLQSNALDQRCLRGSGGTRGRCRVLIDDALATTSRVHITATATFGGRDVSCRRQPLLDQKQGNLLVTCTNSAVKQSPFSTIIILVIATRCRAPRLEIGAATDEHLQSNVCRSV